LGDQDPSGEAELMKIWDLTSELFLARPRPDDRVRVYITFDSGEDYITAGYLPRVDADLLLAGFGLAQVPAFLTKIFGGRRVVKAHLVFGPTEAN
jgi:hypothetical protein